MPPIKAVAVPGAARQYSRQTLRALLGSLLVSASLLEAPLLQAQRDSLPYLLFDPVVLQITETPEAETPYTAQELSALPQGQTVELQSWLDSRNVTLIPLDEITDDISAYEQSVVELELSGGAYNVQLDQELLALGTLLQQAGDYTRAQEVLERASHINRVNKGLFGMSQVPIIERMIENHIARGDLLAADEQQEYLLYLHRKNFGETSMDLLPALTRYAEWNLFAFRAPLVAAPSPQTGEESSEPESRPDENSKVMQEFRNSRLTNAGNVYQSVIQILTSNFGATDNRLLNLERQLALTNYLFISTFGLGTEFSTSAVLPYGSYLLPFDANKIGRPTLGFRQGRDALERRVTYVVNEPDTAPVERAQARLDLADWLLMFSKRMGALELYSATYQESFAADATAEELADLFNPPYPLEIPSYVEHAYTREALDIPADMALEYKGYIDIEFQLNRFGTPSSLHVLGKSPTASPAVEARLLRKIRHSQYRPRIVDGAARATEWVRARFYYTY